MRRTLGTGKRRLLTRLAITGLALAHAGCAGVPAVRSPDTAGSMAEPGTRDRVSAAAVYDRGAGQTLFVDDDGRSLRRVVTEPDGSGRWAVELRDDDRAGALLRLVEMERSGGAARMRALADYRGQAGEETERSRVVFDPPLTLLPPSLGAEPFESNADAVMTRGRTTSAGEAVRTVAFVGMQVVRLHAGDGPGEPIEAACIESTLTMRFGQTRVVRVERLWVTQERGIVATSASVSVTFAGFPVRSSSSLKLARE